MESDIKPDDFAATLAPKSDQLNADDLRTGPRVYTITRIAKTKGGDGKQPVSIYLAEHAAGPWKPCKSERRILAECWDPNPANWPDGARVELWRNPEVRYGGDPVGGIQVLSVSHMDRPLNTSRTVSRGTREKCVIKVLPTPPAAKQFEIPRPAIGAVLTSAGLTMADLDAYVVSLGKPATSSLDARAQQATADALAAAPDKLEAVKAHRDASKAKPATPAQQGLGGLAPADPVDDPPELDDDDPDKF